VGLKRGPLGLVRINEELLERRVAASIVLRLLVTAKIPDPPILVTLMMEEILSCETSALTRDIRRNIQEDGILHSQSRENFNLI
jgi:hypothetical protein